MTNQNYTPQKKSFVLHLDSYDAIEGFTDAELGKLTRLIFHHHKNLNNPVAFHVSPKVLTAFAFFKAQFLRDAEKYQEIATIRSEVGKRGGMASAEKRWGKSEATVVSKSKQSNQVVKKVSKVTDSDSDSVLLASNVDTLKKDLPKTNVLSLQEAWDKYSAAAFQEKGISDLRVVEEGRKEFVSKAKYATQNAVSGFVRGMKTKSVNSLGDWKDEIPNG